MQNRVAVLTLCLCFIVIPSYCTNRSIQLKKQEWHFLTMRNNMVTNIYDFTEIILERDPSCRVRWRRNENNLSGQELTKKLKHCNDGLLHLWRVISTKEEGELKYSIDDEEESYLSVKLVPEKWIPIPYLYITPSEVNFMFAKFMNDRISFDVATNSQMAKYDGTWNKIINITHGCWIKIYGEHSCDLVFTYDKYNDPDFRALGFMSPGLTASQHQKDLAVTSDAMAYKSSSDSLIWYPSNKAIAADKVKKVVAMAKNGIYIRVGNRSATFSYSDLALPAAPSREDDVRGMNYGDQLEFQFLTAVAKEELAAYPDFFTAKTARRPNRNFYKPTKAR